MSNQGNRDQEGTPGQTGSDPARPAGTPGRTGNTGTENWQQGNTDPNRQGGTQPKRPDDDEDSPFGNRMTNW